MQTAVFLCFLVNSMKIMTIDSNKILKFAWKALKYFVIVDLSLALLWVIAQDSRVKIALEKNKELEFVINNIDKKVFDSLDTYRSVIVEIWKMDSISNYRYKWSLFDSYFPDSLSFEVFRKVTQEFWHNQNSNWNNRNYAYVLWLYNVLWSPQLSADSTKCFLTEVFGSEFNKAHAYPGWICFWDKRISSRLLEAELTHHFQFGYCGFEDYVVNFLILLKIYNTPEYWIWAIFDWKSIYDNSYNKNEVGTIEFDAHEIIEILIGKFKYISLNKKWIYEKNKLQDFLKINRYLQVQNQFPTSPQSLLFTQ